MADSSSSSDENTVAPYVATAKTWKKQFVFLKSKVKSVPRGSLWKEHENEGIVREVAVSPSSTSTQLAVQLKANIPSLVDVDLTK